MNPRYKFGVWLGVRNNNAECFVVTAEGAFRASLARRSELQDKEEQRSHQQRDRSLVQNRGRQADCGQADDTD